MRFKFGILLMLLATLSIANAGSTTNLNPPPDACPTIAAIQSEGVSIAYEFAPKVFFALQRSTYQTSHSWYFAIGFFPADTLEDAIQNGNRYLAQLTDSIPPFYDEEGYWVCGYKVAATELTAIAFYAEPPYSPMEARRLLKKIH